MITQKTILLSVLAASYATTTASEELCRCAVSSEPGNNVVEGIRVLPKSDPACSPFLSKFFHRRQLSQTTPAAEPSERELTGHYCGPLGACYIISAGDDRSYTDVRLEEGATYAAGGDYTLLCDVPDGNLQSFSFAFGDGSGRTEFNAPYHGGGEANNGEFLVPVDYLSYCGEKTVTVQGDIYGEVCFSITYRFEARCDDAAECGNGILEDGESCDDGNSANGDGCDSSCFLEPACGNGVVEEGEDCDLGFENGGPGCRFDCTRPTCGDFILDAVSYTHLTLPTKRIV